MLTSRCLFGRHLQVLKHSRQLTELLHVAVTMPKVRAWGIRGCRARLAMVRASVVCLRLPTMSLECTRSRGAVAASNHRTHVPCATPIAYAVTTDAARLLHGRSVESCSLGGRQPCRRWGAAARGERFAPKRQSPSSLREMARYVLDTVVGRGACRVANVCSDLLW
jgi:hypothetical protein